MLHGVNRRTALAGIACSLPLLTKLRAFGVESQRAFTMDLCPGRIGVNVGQTELIELASKYGFESVEPFGSSLASLKGDGISELNDVLKEKQLVWGAAGLSVEFRKDEAKYKEDLDALPAIAKALQAAGVTRVGTWIMPAHDELTYRANFAQHARRLRGAAQVLGEYGLKLGLEYVGPRTLWSSKKYAFIHTLAETKELIAAIDTGNVGLVLDSWHWYTAEETAADLKSLTAEDIVAVDLNDAPTGIDVADQIDNQRELPMATGVIDLKTFLTILVGLKYDGPIRAEPFNKQLNALENGPAVEATANAMRAAFELVA